MILYLCSIMLSPPHSCSSVLDAFDSQAHIYKEYEVDCLSIGLLLFAVTLNIHNLRPQTESNLPSVTPPPLADYLHGGKRLFVPGPQ